MRFSIYSELQSWPGKSQRQVYDEAIEQVVNADRLGYYAYAIIEHFFFPKFGASPNPLAFFAKCSERTKNIVFRTLVHVLPFHNPAVLASQIAAFDLLVEGRYEFGVGRGHAWLAHKAGIPVEETRERYEEALGILLDALDLERFSHDGTYFKVEDSHIVPRPPAGRKFRISLGDGQPRKPQVSSHASSAPTARMASASAVNHGHLRLRKRRGGSLGSGRRRARRSLRRPGRSYAINDRRFYSV